jgi:hypothetical protein
MRLVFSQQLKRLSLVLITVLTLSVAPVASAKSGKKDQNGQKVNACGVCPQKTTVTNPCTVCPQKTTVTDPCTVCPQKPTVVTTPCTVCPAPVTKTDSCAPPPRAKPAPVQSCPSSCQPAPNITGIDYSCPKPETFCETASCTVEKLDTLLDNPEEYMGRAVTVDGEMHRIFNDRVFSIEDDDFFRDDDLLIISTCASSDVVYPLEDTIDPGKNVRVTGVIEPFNWTSLECKYGPLQIEPRITHYKEGEPVMIIDRRPAAVEAKKEELPPVIIEESVEIFPPPAPIIEPPAPAPVIEPPVVREKPSVVQEAPPAPAPKRRRLPQTASGSPLPAFFGMMALCTGYGLRLRPRL